MILVLARMETVYLNTVGGGTKPIATPTASIFNGSLAEALVWTEGGEYQLMKFRDSVKDPIGTAKMKLLKKGKL